MFHQNQRSRAGIAHGLNRLDAKVHVLVGDVLGLIAVEIVVAVFRVLRFQYFRGDIAQIAVQLHLSQLMQEGALLRIDRRFVLKLLREFYAGRTHEPAMR